MIVIAHSHHFIYGLSEVNAAQLGVKTVSREQVKVTGGVTFQFALLLDFHLQREKGNGQRLHKTTLKRGGERKTVMIF